MNMLNVTFFSLTDSKFVARTIVVSKSMRTVDIETRQEVIQTPFEFHICNSIFSDFFQVKDKRLIALEADNYVEEQETADDAYDGSDVILSYFYAYTQYS